MASGEVLYPATLPWNKDARIAVTRDELQLAAVCKALLSDPDWLIPLVAAQVQYRAVYYGMTAAALLEDVWTDALSNWLARHLPMVVLHKDRRGAKAESGDYRLNGLRTSFKAGLGPTETAIHWDATVERREEWTSPTTLTYFSAAYAGKTGLWSSPSASGSTRVVWPAEKRVFSTWCLGLLREVQDGLSQWEVVAKWSAFPSFVDVWAYVGSLFAQGTPANHIEMMWLPKKVQAGEVGVLETPLAPGVYVLPKSMLSSIPLGQNNRGSTLSPQTVQDLLTATGGVPSNPRLFARVPIWYARFAPPRPPDLYLALRSSWDERFSPVTNPSPAVEVTEEGDTDRST